MNGIIQLQDQERNKKKAKEESSGGGAARAAQCRAKPGQVS